MNIAIITARGGSKRIPRKNILPFLGRPMIAWPIEAAQNAGVFDRILVSTDDAEIAKIARDAGAEVPFMRPSALADDYTPAHLAAKQMLEWAIAEGNTIDAFCHIYPTAPLLSAETLKAGMHAITEEKRPAAWVMTHLPFPIYQVMGKDHDGKLFRFFSDDKAALRSQDMPKAYVDVGQAYFFQTDYFLNHEMRIDAHLGVIEIPFEHAIDIDTPEDWQKAEALARRLAP